MSAGWLLLLSGVMGEPMEMTATVAALLAAAGGLVVLAASVLRSAAAHRQDLLAAGVQVANRLHLRRLAGPRRARGVWARSRRPARLLGMTAALGLLLIAAVAIGAGQLVEDAAAGGGIAVVDHPVAGFVAAHRSGWLTPVMRAVSAVGGPLILAAVTAAAAGLLSVLRRSLGPALLAGLTVAGTGGLTIILKEALGRSRPSLDEALAAAEGHAFPSAHAATAAAVFGILAYLYTARLRSWSARVTVWAGAGMLTALVGTSRVYLGVHWTTDVIGGWVFGVVWLAVVVTGWTIFTSHRGGRPGIPGPVGGGDHDPGGWQVGRVSRGAPSRPGPCVPDLSDGRPADRCDGSTT